MMTIHRIELRLTLGVLLVALLALSGAAQTPSQRLDDGKDRDFRLKPGSAAIDRGVAIPNVNDGFAGTASDLGAMAAGQSPPIYGRRPVESRVAAGSASLYARAVGQGVPMIVLHGGPDFDHQYLLPEFDRFQDAFRLVYYDQRGRGRSTENVKAEDVTLASDLADLDLVRQHYQLHAPVLLGHSWGALLALEYALLHPDRVSHLILMNPAPASTADMGVMRKFYLSKLGAEMDKQRAIATGAAYQSGDPEAVVERYRIHFKPALKREGDYEKLMTSMRGAFISQGKEGILLARAVEDRLMRDTWEVPTYDLLPRLKNLRVPTLVIAGDSDFIPVEVAERIAAALPNAQLVTIKECGHFAYLECAPDVRRAFEAFVKRP